MEQDSVWPLFFFLSHFPFFFLFVNTGTKIYYASKWAGGTVPSKGQRNWHGSDRAQNNKTIPEEKNPSGEGIRWCKFLSFFLSLKRRHWKKKKEDNRINYLCLQRPS